MFGVSMQRDRKKDRTNIKSVNKYKESSIKRGTDMDICGRLHFDCLFKCIKGTHWVTRGK